MAEEVVGIRLALRDRAAAAKGLQDTVTDVEEIGDAAERTSKKTRGALDLLSKLGTTVSRAAKLGVGAVTALGAAGVAAGVKIAASNEQAGISFTTMLGDGQKARAFLGKLAAFAAKTPFDFPGLQRSASSLVSAGIDADKIIPIMTSLGNATSGMGTGAEGIARATVAIQQMTAAQKISGEDLNQLRDAGVPVYDLLAAATGKSTAAVAELAQEGKLGRAELEQLMAALETGKGLERFNGLMDKQSQSLSGMWSSFTDTVSMGLGRVLEPWMPTLKLGLGQLTTAAGPFFDGLLTRSEELARKGPYAIGLIRRGVRDAVPYLQQAQDYVGGLVDRLRSGEVDTSALSDLGTAALELAGAAPALTAQLPTINDGLRVAGVVTGFLADHVDTLAYLMPVLAAGFAIYKVAQLGANVAEIAAVPTMIAQVIATRSLASANRALAATTGAGTVATTANTAATNVSTISRGRALIGLAATRVAMLAGAAATGVATGAQWLLNVALSANPIGLVVLAIAGLVAGFVLAYQKSEKFRSVVDGLWQRLKDLWSWVKNVGGGFLKMLTGGGAGDYVSAVTTLPGRATGGLVQSGRPYVVGERRPEVFVPRQSGRISPSLERYADEDLTGTLAGVGGGDLRVPVAIDGRQVGEAVVKDFRRQLARR